MIGGADTRLAPTPESPCLLGFSADGWTATPQVGGAPCR